MLFEDYDVSFIGMYYRPTVLCANIIQEVDA